MNAELGPNAGPGNLLSGVIIPLGNEANKIIQTVGVSTEEMLRCFKDYNKRCSDYWSGWRRGCVYRA